MALIEHKQINWQPDTTTFPEPKNLTVEQAEAEVTVINSEIRALSTFVRPYRIWIERVNRRIETLVKQKHILQTHIIVGITKVAMGKRGPLATELDVKKFIEGMEPEARNALLNWALAKAEK